MMRHLLLALVLLALALSPACSDEHDHDHDHGSPADTQGNAQSDAGGTSGDAGASGTIKLLVLGDSALDWNEDKSTGDQVGDVLTEKGVSNSVTNNSVSGATLGCGEDNVGDAQNCIPPQYVAGDWTHVLISGGANDVDEACQLSADVIISADLKSGLMVDSVNKLTGAGHKVLLYRYFGTLDPKHPLNTCEQIQKINQRYKELAASRDDVIEIDAGAVVKNSDAKLYAADGIHPSPEGSRVIAEHIVKVLGY